MSRSDVVAKGPGKAFMMANEAMVRGALEADVKLYAGYPGSPTSEILDTFYEIHKEMDMRMEISTNEKVAIETAAAAAFAGLRSMTSMKSVGLNVASDSFFSIGYVGVKGGFVMVFADDPYAHSSQSEQDGRLYAPAAYIPMLEPSDPTEAKAMVKQAFDLSEKFGTLVIVRTVTRVNHQSGIVELEPLKRTPFAKVKWPHEPTRFITLADKARAFKKIILERTVKLEEEFERSPLNRVEKGEGDTGIITASAAYNYSVEASELLGIRPHILKLGTTFPLPKKLISDFIRPFKRVVLVEELSPYMENAVKAIAKDVNPAIEIIGKGTGHFSESLEYNTNIVAVVLASVFGKRTPVDYSAVLERAEKLKEGLPVRPPTFCPGCPHRGTLYSLRKALRGVKHVVATDIGCYSMSPLAPLHYGDTMLSMGASLGVAEGLQYCVEEPVVALIGDSTFMHAGLPGLVNAVWHKGNFKLFILDNSVTAMTGQQQNPNSPIHEGADEQKLMLEDIVKGLGVKDITIVDPYDMKATPVKMKEILTRPGLSVVISRRECALYGDRNKRRKGQAIIPNEVDAAACKRIYACVREFHCPSISVDANRKATISKELCDGCNECGQLCPANVIKPSGGGQK